MKTYDEKLDALGLARELFDTDNKERIERAQQLHAELAKRMRELEQLPEWRDKEYVWSAERADYLEQNPTGSEPVGAEAVMSQHNMLWRRNLLRWCKDHQIGFYRLNRALASTAARKGNKRAEGHRLAAEAARRGIDLEKLREEYRLKREQETGE